MKQLYGLSIIGLVMTAGLWSAYGFYDPGPQRWLNRDPLEEMGGLNQYGFVRNAPIDDFDVNGRIDKQTVPGPDLGTYLDQLCKCYEMIMRVTHEAEEWANRNYGYPGQTHQNEGSIADMLTHCVASCELAKNEATCSSALYDVKKKWQEREHPKERGGDRMDYENNRIGFAIASQGMDCKQGCMRAFGEGWLWTVDPVPPHRAHPVGGSRPPGAPRL